MDCYHDINDLDVGHSLIALDPEAFMPRSEFQNRLQKLIDQVKSAAPIEPGKEILLPGDLEVRRMQQRLKEGIPVAPTTVKRVRDLCEEIGFDCPL